MIIYSENAKYELLDRKLQIICDVMSRVLDIDVIATSGLRTPEHNAEIGGVPNSSHLKGLAIDIATPDSFVRWKVLNAGITAGFKRICVPTDLAHLHFDIDPDKPQNILAKD